ncbi:hypothetical protein [Winogradskyella sp. UBA3174]|nr:hypothetical protein [Winogradskyella sp. UBA3174]
MMSEQLNKSDVKDTEASSFSLTDINGYPTNIVILKMLTMQVL